MWLPLLLCSHLYPDPLDLTSKFLCALSSDYPSSQHQEAFSRNPQASPFRETGRLTAALLHFLFPFKSYLSTHNIICSRPSVVSSPLLSLVPMYSFLPSQFFLTLFQCPTPTGTPWELTGHSDQRNRQPNSDLKDVS